MDFKTKRNCKRKSILFNRLGYGMLVLLVMAFVLLLVINVRYNPNKDVPNYVNIILGIIMIVTMILGLIFSFTAEMYRLQLIRYKANIRKYRTRVLFYKCIHNVIDDNINEALKYYKLVPDGYLDNVLFGLLIGKALHSSNVEFSERGEKHLEMLLNDYNPNDIKFENYVKPNNASNTI